jgi:hypothetical protein
MDEVRAAGDDMKAVLEEAAQADENMRTSAGLH